jgi:TPR repeat protein
MFLTSMYLFSTGKNFLMIHSIKNKKYFMRGTSTRITPPLLAGLIFIGSLIPSSAHADGPFTPSENVVCPDKTKAQAGSAADEYALARAYDKGYCGIATDQKAAIQWYTLAAEHGSMMAQYWLGEIYFSGSSNNGVSDYPAAKKWFRAAAEQGQGLAQLRLAYLCAEKHYKGVSSDYKEAEKWFIKAAEQNAGDAQFRLGNFYHNYKNPPDFKQAVYWLTRAAEGGNRLAKFDLSRMLKKGEGAPKNPEQAVIWMKKAAALDMLPAQMMLSEMYASGDGVKKDPAQSLAWTLKVTQNPSAIPYWIDKAADAVFTGSKDIPQNYPQALGLYLRAAAKNDPHAEARLGRMYLKGLGVMTDRTKARAYLKKAAAAGDTEAKDLLAGKG